jgi:hypothetical protein
MHLNRDTDAPMAAREVGHGFAVPRGQAQPFGGGRFDHMFPRVPIRDPGDEALGALANWMEYRPPPGTYRIELSVENEEIQAGFTYLGQFIDHDLTFDARSKLERDRDPNALVNFRTPRLDLDSVYGGGPEVQPYLYAWEGSRRPGPKLLLRRRSSSIYAQEDLPRNHEGHAIIGDPRNDENLIVAQLHLLFIKFHNKVADRVAGRHVAGGGQFEEAQQIVRWHYQWIVLHEFLPKVVGDKTVASVVTARAADRQLFRWEDQPFMPIEFSGAAFRFGHSMVRESYTINLDPKNKAASVRLFHLPGLPNPHLEGMRRLPKTLVIDWKHFFKTDPRTRVVPSMRIDPSLAPPLFKLPTDGSSLVQRDLLRGRDLKVPAGQDIARALGQQELLTDKELFLSRPAPDVVSPEARKALLNATPLWYYILCEAKKGGSEGGENGTRLGPIGGRIVAEVLIGLLEADEYSYVRQQPTWTPELPRARPDTFTMADLVRFVEQD